MQKKLTTSAADFLPRTKTLPALKKAAKNCQGCHLYREATQTVFGNGSADAKLMVVGEIPGDVEDQRGEPFTGPAGKLLRNSVEKSGLDVEEIYFTNVVKHFKFVYSPHRRLHRSPAGPEISACMPWLEAEIEVISPQIILCLGATAAKALVSKNFHITKQRGEWFERSAGTNIVATYHPSAILRAPDISTRRMMQKFFVQDLKAVANYLKKIA